MRICGKYLVLVVLATLSLAGCGGGEDASAAGGSGNLPPIIAGTPPTSLTAGTAYSFTPQAADPDGDKLTFSATNVPAWATFNTTTGTLSGTPTEANIGMTGMITIEVSDSKAITQLPEFRIQVMSNGTAPGVVNTPPTIAGTPAVGATVGQVYTFSPVGQDVDNDTLTFEIVNKPSWATFTSATGQLTGTPTATDVGTTNNIVIRVSDGEASAELPAFNLQVAAAPVTPPVNRAPTITGTPNASVTAGSAYNFQPVASDPDGNSLLFSIQNQPSWATFSASTGKLSGTPVAANVGTTARITISVSDGTATVSLPSFTIQVNAAANRAPVISGTAQTSVTAGTAYSFQPSASDADGDTLTFSVANKPAWATLTPATGRLSGTPAATDVGSFSNIVISVSDGKTSVSLAAFTIQVNAVAATNRAPVISGSPLTSLAAGTAYSFQPTASDADNDTLTFSITNKPAWATFSTSTGKLSGTPALTDVASFGNIVIAVTDGKASASLPAFAIAVIQLATGSATVSWTPPTTNTDGSALTDLAGYRLAYGRSSTNLDQSASVSNAGLTTYTVNSLSAGDWFFAVYAVNSVGIESGISNVATKTIQ